MEDHTSLRGKIAGTIQRVAIARDVPISPRHWQVDMAAGMLEGLDQVCVTKTGDGKTFCYLLAAMHDPAKVFLIVSPLLALIEDQVSEYLVTETLETRLIHAW